MNQSCNYTAVLNFFTSWISWRGCLLIPHPPPFPTPKLSLWVSHEFSILGRSETLLPLPFYLWAGHFQNTHSIYMYLCIKLVIFFLPPLVPLYMYPSVYLLVGGWGLSPPPPPLHLTLGPPPIQTQHSRGSAPWPGQCPPKNIKKQPSMLYDKLQTITTLDGTWIWKLAPAFMIWRWQKWVYNIFKSQIWSLGVFMLPHRHILTCTYIHMYMYI